MITIFRDQKDAYTKNTIFRIYREEERKLLAEDRELQKANIIEPLQFSNICKFPDHNLRG